LALEVLAPTLSRATLSCWTISSPQRAGNREAVEAAGAKLKQRRANPWFTSEGRSTAAPPLGQFLEINAVRLHYIERGAGEPLVLLHRNGSMIQDFESTGLIDLAAKNYRVIVFDRPGFGHSDWPRNVIWAPAAQAELINNALQRLGVSQALVLGRS